MAIKFNGLNFAAFAPEFTVHCLQRGSPGFLLMKRHLSNDDSSGRSLAEDRSSCPDFDEVEFGRNKQLLFFDLLNSCTPEVRFQLKLRLRDGQEGSTPVEGSAEDGTTTDIWTNILLTLDCVALWDQMKDMELWYKDHSIAILETNHKRLSTRKALLSIVSGDYIRTSWMSNANPSDLQEDIVNISSNQALICALVLTISLPLFVQSSDFDHSGSYYSQIYTFFLGVATCAEAAAVLVCLRNILAVKIVELQHLHKFTELAHGALLLPNKLNVLAVVSLITGLLSYGFWKFGIYRFMIFMVAAVIPSAATTNFYIVHGLKALYAVQPWDSGASAVPPPSQRITTNIANDFELTKIFESATNV